jgi:hypothetical protein
MRGIGSRWKNRKVEIDALTNINPSVWTDLFQVKWHCYVGAVEIKIKPCVVLTEGFLSDFCHSFWHHTKPGPRDLSDSEDYLIPDELLSGQG